MTFLQVLSDLHLESPKAYDIFSITPKAPYLALLGDIGNVALHKADCLAFLTRLLNQFRTILFVPGNHEAYHSNWPTTLSILRTFEKDISNDDSLGEFVLLDRTVYEIPDTNFVILGCSLFSFVPPDSHVAVSQGLNDFFTTDEWNIDSHNESHARDLAWLNTKVTSLEQSDVRIMILTHWSPSRDTRSFDQRHANSLITSAFSTDLSKEECFRSEKVTIWAFGHTHYNCDFTIERQGGESLRLLTNQRGYYFAQAEGFDECKIVAI